LNIENFLSLKPKSIFEVVPSYIFREKETDEHRSYICSENYYEFYYAISKYFKPKTILEIGVRLGYSFASMYAGSFDTIKYMEGWDNCSYVENSVEISKINLKNFIKCDFNILDIDSHIQIMKEYYDLIHIDGDHTYDGAIKDLELTKLHAKTIIVDDYAAFDTVKNAVNDFVRQNNLENKLSYIPSCQGMAVLELS